MPSRPSISTPDDAGVPAAVASMVADFDGGGDPGRSRGTPIPSGGGESAPCAFSRAIQKARRFHLEIPSLETGGLTVASCGWELCAPEHQIKRDGFPYYVVELVIGGSGELFLNGCHHTLARGSIFSFGPGCAYELTSSPEQPLSKYFVCLAGADSLRLMREQSIEPGTCRKSADVDGIQAAFEQILGDGRRMTKLTPRIVALDVERLLLKMASVLEPRQWQHRSYQTFVRCREYLDIHFLRLHNASDAASACHVDAAYLSKLFARYHPNSLHEYLIRKKMFWAATLLGEGQALVRDVADRLGMEAFHFSRVFKRVHGIAPIKFMQFHAQPLSSGNEDR